MKKYLLINICLIVFTALNGQNADSLYKVYTEEIYYDKGVNKFNSGQYTQALYWYEKGIETAPLYEENYYGAAKVFFLSTETVWGVMYGELFMILSHNDSLQAEISKELFNAYFESFSLNKCKIPPNLILT